MFSTCMSTTGMAEYEYQRYLQLHAARLDVLWGGGEMGSAVYMRAPARVGCTAARVSSRWAASAVLVTLIQPVSI